MRQYELDTWNALPKHRQYWDRFPPCKWTVKQLSKHQLTILELQLWARLKLQGHYGEGGPEDGSLLQHCRLCGSSSPETAGHVLSGCCHFTGKKMNSLKHQLFGAEVAWQEGWFSEYVLGMADTEAAAVACVKLVAAIGQAARTRCVL